MLLLILFAFIGGIVTILSPCILSVLPIILSPLNSKSRPFGVILGFISSFTFSTLFLTSIVRATGIPADTLRFLSISIITLFGISLLIPKVQTLIELLFARLSRFAPWAKNNPTLLSGLLVGLSLGLLWTPYAGPILASVISLALTGGVTKEATIITLAYATGTTISMFTIMKAGSRVLTSTPWLARNTGKIQRAFGVLMILTAIAIYANIDRRFQAYILEKFPNYGTGLTSIEDNTLVREGLKEMMPDQRPTTNDQSYPVAPELIPSGEWVGSTPLTINSLKGKTVLIDFWTYSCINCIRTLPYLKSWWEKYQDDGLMIIGVHTPKFEFEKSLPNLKKAVTDFDLKYPIVQDNDYKTWRAYDNHYWPAKYLIDKDGEIRYKHFGEGKYDETEKMIQILLAEMGSKVKEKIDNPPYSIDAQTPETYLGYRQMDGFASNEKITRDEFANYTLPEQIDMNFFAYKGEWKVTTEYSENKNGASLIFGFSAKKVFLVMGSPTPTRVRIYLDGKEEKAITVNEEKLYELIKLDQPGNHVLWLEFLGDGTRIYAFTFG